MYQYKILENTPYEWITECFNRAFSDYYFTVQMRPEQLQKHLEMSGVDLKLSFGAFSEGRMVGFIFNSSSIYNGQRAIFDAGTAVVPEHRGKQVFSNLFQFAEKQLLQQGVEAYYLEVLQQNEKAIRLYQKHGFSIEREYAVLKSSGGFNKGEAYEVEEMEFSDFDLHEAPNCICVKPCFEHSTAILKRNPSLYRVIYQKREGRISSFCIVGKENGAIFQLGYESLPDLKQTIQYLESKFDVITVKNIDTAYDQVLEMLLSMNFAEVTKQFEMSKKLA